MQTFFQDLRYGARMLLKSPGFAFVALFTLALGIGANTAIFSVVNAVLLRPLPFNEPERLVMVWLRGVEAAGGDRTPLAVADLLDWRAQQSTCESVGAFQSASYSYTGGDTPEQIRGARVTANFFSTLGVEAALGRTFQPDEDRPGAGRVVVISRRFWQQYFASDTEVIGRAITLSQTSYTIVGVMPEAFDFPARETDVWAALQLETPSRRGPYFLRGIARLKPGVGLEQARADFKSVKSTYEDRPIKFNVLPINDFIVGEVRPALLVLLAAVTIVLLIAAANVANLMLVRRAAREKEIAIRTALGASRSRIIRQLLTESMLLAIVGGAIGALLAAWGVDILSGLMPRGIPRLEHIKIDGGVLGWTALVSIVTGAVFGLAPALQGSRINLNETLKESGRSTSASISKRRWRNLLVISELAMAVMLLVGAGLLVKSFWRLQQVDPGINPDRVLTMQFALRGAKYAEAKQVDAFYNQLIERAQAISGVEAVAVSNSLPPDETEFSTGFRVEGRRLAVGEQPPVGYVVKVSPDYFRALGIPLRSGRYFNQADSGTSPQVMIISEDIARHFFPGEDPIGRRVNMGDEAKPDMWEIVGVVGDVKYVGMMAETQPTLYMPEAQSPAWGMFLVVKTKAEDPLSLAAAVRSEIRSIDGDLPVSGIASLEDRLSNAVAQPRFRTTLIVIFAAIALMLASVGTYGVISYSVSQRTHEIGIRQALGASTGDIFSLVVKQGMFMTIIGIALGLIAARWLTGGLSDLLFGVSATDSMIFILVPLIMAGVALGACFVPARRATRVDPMEALRYE